MCNFTVHVSFARFAARERDFSRRASVCKFCYSLLLLYPISYSRLIYVLLYDSIKAQQKLLIINVCAGEKKSLACAAAVGTCHMLQPPEIRPRFCHCTAADSLFELSSNYYAKSFTASTLSKFRQKLSSPHERKRWFCVDETDN